MKVSLSKLSTALHSLFPIMTVQHSPNGAKGNSASKLFLNKSYFLFVFAYKVNNSFISIIKYYVL